MSHSFEIKGNSVIPSAGKILISEPLLQDPYFKRSVVLMIDHNTEEGSVGVILNKPLDIPFNKIVKNTPKLNTELYLGGPVEMGNVYFLHTLGTEITNSVKIAKGLYWGGNIEQVNDLIKMKVLNETNIRFFIGYSGWEPMQLDKELDNNNWAIVPAEAGDIWEKPHTNMWNRMVQKLGKKYVFWQTLPEDPSLN